MALENQKFEDLRVVFVHGSLGLGGAEVLRISILEEMVRRGANVEVVILRQPGELADRVRDLGVPVIVLGNRGGLFDVRGVRKLAKWLKENNPDIVQSSQFLTNLHTRLACTISRCKFHIIEEHGIYTWKKWYHRLIDRWINSRAQGVVACSHQVAKSAAKDLGIPVERITVIHNCVAQHHLEENELSNKDRMQIRARLIGTDNILCDGARLVGIVGTLRWEKGHSFLFDAWKALHEKAKLTKHDFLIVVGDGPLRSKLEDKSQTIPNIRFVGSVSDTRTILKSLDIFALPSVNEGFGIAIIEAMAAGLPVITTESGGISEIVNDSSLGILVDPQNSDALELGLTRFLDNAEFAENTGNSGKRSVFERFTPSIYVNQLEGLYGSINAS